MAIEKASKLQRRRRLYYLLFIVILLLSFFVFKSVYKSSDENVKEEVLTKEELFKGFIDRVSELEKEAQEYGENVSITLNSGNLLTYIVYPEGSNDVLNKNIKDWVDDTLYKYIEDSKNATSELSIQSSSFVVDDKYVSVVLKGTYDNSSYAHPEDIVKTFTIDLKKNELVSLSDIFSKKDINKIKKQVIEEANLDTTVVDANLLEDYIFTGDSLKIYLKRGKYTPMSDGNITINLSEDFFKRNNIAYINSKKVAQKETIDNKKIVVNKVEVDEKLKDKKLIALTFDDGPSADTNRLLDILEENNAKATFFVLGCQINKYSDELIRIAKDGHEIANHTWDHKQLTKLSSKQVEEEIMTTRAKIFNTVNIDTLAIRAPYGSVNANVKEVAKKLDMYFVHWSIDTLDWKTRSADATYKAIVEHAGDGQIILCHDIHKQTVDAMDKVIKKLKADGYEFVTVSEMFKLRDKEFEAGKVYYNAK